MSNINNKFQKIDEEFNNKKLRHQIRTGTTAHISFNHDIDKKIINALLEDPSILLEFYKMDDLDIERLRKKVEITVEEYFFENTKTEQSKNNHVANKKNSSTLYYKKNNIK